MVITDSVFTNNGYNGANGSAHIKIFSYNGDAHDPGRDDHRRCAGATPGRASAPDYGIEFHGPCRTTSSRRTTALDRRVVIDDVTVTGDFTRSGGRLTTIADLDDLSITGPTGTGILPRS